MLRLDRNDPLDRMLLQELLDGPVPFDEWEEAMDELDQLDETALDCARIL